MANEVVIAIQTAHYGEVGQLVGGELWAADDPLVKAHPDWFTTDLLANARRSAPAPSKFAHNLQPNK